MSPGETLARRFHEAYERLAPSFGYETRTETREFDPTTRNGKLMIAVCAEVVNPVPPTFVWPDDPEDLRPWGYAPGSYVFTCKDCPADLDIYDKMGRLGDKRSWRCEEHARAAKATHPASNARQDEGTVVNPGAILEADNSPLSHRPKSLGVRSLKRTPPPPAGADDGIA